MTKKKAGIEGGEKAAEFFARAGRQARGGIEQALIMGALRIERDAKLAVPVDTGRLRSSITHRLEDGTKGPVAFVGTNVEYAKYIEFGTGIYAENGKGRQTPWAYQDEDGNWVWTKGSPPKPFLFPAFRQNKDRVKKDLKRAIRKEWGLE